MALNGLTRGGTLFIIDANRATPISPASPFPEEQEWLLCPSPLLRVVRTAVLASAEHGARPPPYTPEYQGTPTYPQVPRHPHTPLDTKATQHTRRY